jgi:hypothetical protein
VIFARGGHHDPPQINDEADARAYIGAAARSGLTRPAWAQAHGIDAHSLDAWFQNLERRAAPPVRFFELEPLARPQPENPPLRLRRGELDLQVPTEFNGAHFLSVPHLMAPR